MTWLKQNWFWIFYILIILITLGYGGALYVGYEDEAIVLTIRRVAIPTLVALFCVTTLVELVRFFKLKKFQDFKYKFNVILLRRIVSIFILMLTLFIFSRFIEWTLPDLYDTLPGPETKRVMDAISEASI